MRRHIDYGLAKRVVVRDVRRGSLTREAVCDAHPELLRAARHIGQESGQACPICEQGPLRYVSYVFGDGLKSANGRCITDPNELERLGESFDELTCYLVEVCIDCSWNHLVRSSLLGRRHAG
jgi:hypothetical protein